MADHKRFILGAALVLAAVATAYRLLPAFDGDVGSVAMAASWPASHVPLAPPRASSNPATLSIERDSVASSPRERAADLYALAKQSADPSVIEKGYLAASRCAAVKDELALPLATEGFAAAVKQRHASARQVIIEFCDGMDEEAFFRERELMAKNGAAKGSRHLEVLATLMDRDRVPLGEDARMCGWILAAKDHPDLLRTLIPALVPVSRETLYGKPYSGYMRGIFGAALDLSACRLGSACRADDWLALRVCGVDGICGNTDLVTAYLQSLPTDQARTDVVQLAEHIVGDIRAGRCEKLLAASFR